MGGKSGGSRDARMRQLIATYLKKGSKTDSGDLVAAVEAPAELIKSKDPIEDVEVAILDLEPIAPQKAAKPKIQKPEKIPVVTAYAEEPVKRPNVGLGKIDETVTASVKKGVKQNSPGGWMVQIAAADSVDGANALLEKARSKGGKSVASASNFIQQTEKNGQTLHRARFAGFGSQQAAINACNALKKQKVSCFAVAG